jgi:hypothetical protein
VEEVKTEKPDGLDEKSSLNNELLLVKLRIEEREVWRKNHY